VLLALAATSPSAAGARVASSSLLITYTTPTTLQVALADGTPVASGSSIPAGSYMVTVKDDPNTGDLNPDLTISGPGVSLSNNLNSSGMGIDQTSTFGPYSFQAGSSYTIEDTTLGSSTLVSFTVSGSAGGSSSSGSQGTSGGQTSGSPSGGGSSSSGAGGAAHSTAGGSTSTSGSRTVKTLGTLAASVSATARASLVLGGRAVKTLRAGTYTLTIEDHSKSAGFELGQVSKAAMALSAAVGSAHGSRTVVLRAGKWFFAASKGSKTYFTVTA
jgi:hypothetical protein